MMSAELDFGSVPSIYREVCDILCPEPGSTVDRDLFMKLLIKSSLPKQTLLEIWEHTESGEGCINSSGVLKALALVAFAQQGKTVSPKLLLNFSDEEPPRPSLGDLSDLRVLASNFRRSKNPARLGVTYKDVCALDTIQVKLIPKKKGLILKHVEYEVTSQKNNSSVERRYNDFVAFHEMILQRYAYRMIPVLPPKKMSTDPIFIEERRKALKRYLTLIARHPLITDDRILQFFLTYSGSDVQSKIKDQFKNHPDEFLTSEVAASAKNLVPMDSSFQFQSVREQIKNIHSSIMILRDAAERTVERSNSLAGDSLLWAKELSTLANCQNSDSDWGSSGHNTWETLKEDFRSLNSMFTSLGEAALVQAHLEDDNVIQEINLLLDCVTAYNDLCERHLNGVIHGHQKAINKMKRKSAVGSLSMDDIENQAQQLENRGHFSLHCIHMETQLVNVYMEIMSSVLKSLVLIEARGHGQIAGIWEKMSHAVHGITNGEK